MLNYLWSGMIILSIVFSLGADITDEINNTYKNGNVYEFEFLPRDSSGFSSIYLYQTKVNFSASDLAGGSLMIPVSDKLPELWQRIAEQQSSKLKNELRAQITGIDADKHRMQFSLPPVHWVKIRAITDAAFTTAEFAVKLALGLAGIMALWLGLMRIAEKSGLISHFVRLIFPLLHWLFPAIDKNHPVLGSISLNMTANILGLGNAATPMGIKAMQQLQTLNTKKDEASDEMCMFLAINTSSVQLLPPVTLIALMGASVSELIVPIIFATSASTIAAVTSAKLFARLRQK